jgi:CBS domain containing-hemolysin-like protein
MSVEILLVISAVAFLMAAFFAGSETAIIASDRIRLRHLSRQGDRRARLVLDYVKNPEHFLSIVLAGTNLGMIGCTAAFTAVMIRRYGDSGEWFASLILVPSLLIFQEIVPKVIFLYYAERASILSIIPLKVFAISLYPVIKALSWLSNMLARAVGVGRVDRRVTMTMEELLFHLRGSGEAGLISSDTVALASRASELMDFTAADVMVPLDRVVMAESGLSRSEYRSVFKRERFSRLPIYRGDRQNVVGFLFVHSFLKVRGQQNEPLTFDRPYIVRAGDPIVGMLVRMKNQGCHMAMVRGEHGKLVGMTTLEDILERLVGAIADEFH